MNEREKERFREHVRGMYETDIDPVLYSIIGVCAQSSSNKAIKRVKHEIAEKLANTEDIEAEIYNLLAEA
ncbi:MAG: hypothetical protein GY775_15870 [Candidatus Scalindua sp.]|nr:hypothetical protein [Candidatus Scalindua sp.]